MQNNKALELAWDFIEKTNRSVFLTGKAGTGKTTFLHNLKNKSLKRHVVLAPTGVAAINACGVTIHSFFQMPFGPILPEANINRLSSSKSFQRKFSRNKINIIKSLDLLIIDEISMVRADLLDGIDQILRKYKNRNKVFGGIQVLMIGDLQQLAPVVKDAEWNLLKDYYQTAFFFSSRAFQKCNAINIELTHIYRQKNEKFIKILNEIRTNSLSNESTKILNNRYVPNFIPPKNKNYITLTTHNKRADSINIATLNAIDSDSYHYKAQIDGKFPDHTFPTFQELVLKIGAQVMFIKNDTTPEKRFFNGKIGTVIALNNKKVSVLSPDDADVIIVEPLTWENVSYTINSETKDISEKIIGSFSQIPLRLAWAITIHKSQGLTFEKAIIDAQASFAHGQTYVALSRCTSLEGVVLKTPIQSSSIINDTSIDEFNKLVEENPPNKEDLNESHKNFQLQLLEEMFNYYQLLYPINRLIAIFNQHKNSIQGTVLNPLKKIKIAGITKLLQIASAFKNQLLVLSEGVYDIENNQIIKERIHKAIHYFIIHTQEHIQKPFKKINYLTENKAIQQDFEKNLNQFLELLELKLYIFNSLKNNYSFTNYLQIRAKGILQEVKTKKVKKEFKTTTNHPVLFEELKQLRAFFAEEKQVAHYQIFTQRSLFEMCEVLPSSKEKLLKINGFGKVRVQNYGEEILDVIHHYCIEHGLQINQKITKSIENITSNSKKVFKPQKKASHLVTLEMFKNGLTINEIAKKRGFVSGTIENHLMKHVISGELEITDLIPIEKYLELKKIIDTISFENLTELKNKIDSKFTYNELRMVLKTLDVN